MSTGDLGGASEHSVKKDVTRSHERRLDDLRGDLGRSGVLALFLSITTVVTPGCSGDVRKGASAVVDERSPDSGVVAVDAGAPDGTSASVDSGTETSDSDTREAGTCVPSYTITPVPVHVVEGGAYLINGLGQVAGQDINGHPFIWTPGAAPYFFEDMGASSGHLLDLDDYGRAVGAFDHPTSCSSEGCGFVWSPPGSQPDAGPWPPGMTWLPSTCGMPPTPMAIANAGWIVGQDPCLGDFGVEFVPAGGNVPLPVPADCSSMYVTDVNDSFTFVGWCGLNSAVAPTGGTRAVRGSRASAALLPALDGYGTYANALNDEGLAVGTSARFNGSSAAVLFDSFGDLIALPGLAAPPDKLLSDAAYDVNDAGLIVGTATIRADDGTSFHDQAAVAWRDGAILDLNALSCTRASGATITSFPDETSYPEVFLSWATGVNAEGWIVAAGRSWHDTSGNLFLLKPVRS